MGFKKSSSGNFISETMQLNLIMLETGWVEA